MGLDVVGGKPMAQKCIPILYMLNLPRYTIPCLTMGFYLTNGINWSIRVLKGLKKLEFSGRTLIFLSSLSNECGGLISLPPILQNAVSNQIQ